MTSDRQHPLKRLARLALASSLLAALAAAPGQAAEPKRGGTLTVGVETDFYGFDAIKGRVLGEGPASAITPMLERLVEPNENGELEPVLAESLSESDDGKTWTVKLRQGISFHDGTPFNADAVVAHFSRILDPHNKYVGLLFIKPIQSVEKVDDFTVRFNLAHKWIPFESTLSAFAFIGYIPSPKAVADDTMNRSPVGTGPFVFKEWRGGDRLTVVRNPDYRDGGEIHLDEIVFRILPDQQSRYASVQSGEVDVMWTDRGSSILSAEKEPNLTVHTREGKGGQIIFLNASKPPLDDVRVRRALSLAWHQKLYVERLLQGTADFTPHQMGSDVACDVGYPPDGDFQAAKALIEEFGQPVQVSMIHTATQRGKELGEFFQQLAKRSGIEMTLEPVDQPQLVQRVFTNNYMMSGWRIADTQYTAPQLFALLRSDSPYNLARYKSEDMDRLVDALQTAATDAELEAATCAVVRKMHEDAPILITANRRHYAIAQKYVQGLRPLWQGTVDTRFVWLDK